MARSPDDVTSANGKLPHEPIEPELGLEPEPEFEAEYNSDSESLQNSPEFEALKMRLLPVRHVEALLIAKLVPPNEDEAVHMGMGNGPGTEIGSSWRRDEVFVRPGTEWKGVLAKAVRMQAQARIESRASVDANGNSSSNGSQRTGLSSDMQDEPQEVLHSCRWDIMKLWNDSGVREILWRKKIRLEEFPGL
jgi:guanine nucleotide-binding protein alpha-1 subunit